MCVDVAAFGEGEGNCNLKDLAIPNKRYFLKWNPEFYEPTSTISPTNNFGRKNPVIRISGIRS
jgi:hypothetical protein